ncbi:MAG TPA: glycosyltransferase [Stellaceae bacterium]|nr:glycosyltransferase [Stellaceae bacterium]
MPEPPSFSIVINTDNRADSLARTLESLRHLDYDDFEVCVVCGPSPDGTAEVLEPWRDKIKVEHCPMRNLAVSRNIGIALAAGDIVAFIDDDAVPEAEWLRDLAGAYEAPEIDAAGGFVHDHTGVAYQWRYGTTNRLGETKLDWKRATPELNVAGASSFPTLLGTNCSFRRRILIGLGGFDEEYEYYLEETDLCCRLIDSGGKIAQIAGAIVHHELAPGGRRTERRRLRYWYPTVKNKIYFALVNGRAHHNLPETLRDVTLFIDDYRAALERDIATGEQTEADLARFHAEVARAWGEGLTRGLAGHRQLLRPETLSRYASPFLPFDAPVPVGGRKTFCFLTQHHPPAPMGGIARSVPRLARAIAALGHHAHVLTRATEHDSVDFGDGVWVHRIVPRPAAPPALSKGLTVPQGIWNHAAAMLGGVERIAAHRPVECVYAPLWDCEGVAILLDSRFPLVVEIHTPMHTVVSSQTRLQTDAAFMASVAKPIMALEKRLLSDAAGLRGNSHAIAREIERSYGVILGPRLRVIPHAIEDWRDSPFVAPAPLPPGSIRLLFVGRLEPRKGIDVLLSAAIPLLARFPRAHLDIVGDDTLAGPEGRTYRAMFAADSAYAGIRDRVRFHGEVGEDRLRGFYRACDVFVAPSRFESFGLILLEAMMFAKPVVCCRAGGMPEVVVEGETGLLAEPGDAASLERSLARLIEDPALREKLGDAGRCRYEARFMPERMAKEVAAFLIDKAVAHRRVAAAPRQAAAE